MKLFTRLAPVAVAALLLAGCGSASTSGGSSPAQSMSSTSSATSSPSAAPLSNSTDLTKSTIFKAMTAADQAVVVKDQKLSYDQFLKLDWKERSKVSLVLMDANSAFALSSLSQDPTYGKYASADYGVALKASVQQIQAGFTNGPEVQWWFREAIAFQMAATGDYSQLQDAKKILVGGVTYAPQGWAQPCEGIKDLLGQLDAVNTAKSDSVNRFPGTDTDIANSGYHDGKGFTTVVYAVKLQSPDPYGYTEYMFDDASFKLADGTVQGSWSVNAETYEGLDDRYIGDGWAAK